MDAATWLVGGLFGLFMFFTFVLQYTDRIADLVGRRKQNGG